MKYSENNIMGLLFYDYNPKVVYKISSNGGGTCIIRHSGHGKENGTHFIGYSLKEIAGYLNKGTWTVKEQDYEIF